MVRKEKRYERICGNKDAQNNVKFSDLKKLLENYGFEFIRSRGSHYRYKGTIGDKTIYETIPRKTTVRRVYVKIACEHIDRMIEMTKDGEEETEDNDS